MSGSTSLKSSVQRNIRNNLIAQLPLLSAPAYREGGAPAPKEPKEEPAPAPPAEEDESKGKGGKKGGKGKGGKKGGKKQAEEEEADDEGEITVLDEIWPKKDALGLTKW